jgi:hypothetical protein
MVRLTAAADFNNIKIVTPVVGETTIYNGSLPTAIWWEQAMRMSDGVVNTAVIEKEI